MKCTVCDFSRRSEDYRELSGHFTELAGKSDAAHIMWLNRYVTKKKTDMEDLAEMLARFFSIGQDGLKSWITGKFVDNFFKEPPHLFIRAMQRPERKTLVGYVIEHHYFLKQWIKSCAYIIAKTDEEEVQRYEMENIITEMHGFGKGQPSHHELLLRMGEDLGVPRETVFSTRPLPATEEGVTLWNHIAENNHWLETMAAMHSLELIATRGLEKFGALYPYFNVEIFTREDIPQSAKNFLKEGYEADVSHSDEALNLIERFSREYNDVQGIQATFVRSMVAFDNYLNARLQRGEMFED